MKRKALALLVAACLLMGLAPAVFAAEGAQFQDVPADSWYGSSVSYVVQKGLMVGVGDGLFRPDDRCDRAMLVTVLHRMAHSPQSGGVSFVDVAEDAYYAAAVAWARSRQIVKGYGDGRFGPTDALTREQMLVILHRYAADLGHDVSASESLARFPDGADTADYAQTAVAWGVAVGLIAGTGEGMLEPKGQVTRAQIAVLLARFDALTDVPVEQSRLTLRDFTASQTALAAGTDATVTFTVRLNQRGRAVELRRDDGVVLSQMNDEGREGDSVAGDGVYTALWAIGALPAGTYSCYAASGSAESRRVDISLAAGGTITGRVCRAEGRAAVPGAVLTVYQDGLQIVAVTADDAGLYSLYLPAGSYYIVITGAGFAPFTVYVTVTGGSETYNETYLLVEEAADAAGSASGVITSAITGRGMADVLLEVRSGWNNTAVGGALATAKTDDTGRYTLDLPLGNYTVWASKEGCVPVAVNIVSTAQGAKNQNGTIMPIEGGNVYRMVLTWGETPSDMDSHMVGPAPDGRPFHVSFGTGGVPGPEGTYICNLDVDDTNSFGPETMTLDPQTGATYYYYVQQYSENGTMSGSLSSVRLYRGDSLLATYNVPTNQGDGVVWNVFAIRDGQIVLRHTVTAKPDLTYAN